MLKYIIYNVMSILKYIILNLEYTKYTNWNIDWFILGEYVVLLPLIMGILPFLGATKLHITKPIYVLKSSQYYLNVTQNITIIILVFRELDNQLLISCIKYAFQCICLPQKA